jgi:hypothetical protein
MGLLKDICAGQGALVVHVGVWAMLSACLKCMWQLWCGSHGVAKWQASSQAATSLQVRCLHLQIVSVLDESS